ncbi:MAG TPA: hypothetical protein VKH19_11205 [Gemmatimonadaceae bacterium]|nr:hypothetical protein [Gemmatimonadaceae bacterium]
MRRIGVLLLLVLVLPSARAALERVMATHMLVQIPLLVVAGALITCDLPERWSRRAADWNAGGIAGTLLALIASSWWMVPRALDLSLASHTMELLKFVTLPLFVGAPVAMSWRALGGIGRGFVLANVLPMWAVVGWMYVAAPVRVCNYYLVSEQVMAGTALVAASIALGVLACASAFVSHAHSS